MAGTYLSAALTHVRLLAGVNTLVHSQSRPLDELLAAVGILAHVRTDAAMDAFCRIVSVTTFFGVAAQAPYHDGRGHCVARNPFHKSSTRMLLVDQCRTRGGQPAGSDLVVAAAERMCGRAGWECSCCCSSWASGPASGWAMDNAFRSCHVWAWEGTTGVVAVVAMSNAKSLTGVARRRVQSRSPT